MVVLLVFFFLHYVAVITKSTIKWEPSICCVYLGRPQILYKCQHSRLRKFPASKIISSALILEIPIDFSQP